MKNYIGKCKYCGQTLNVLAYSQEDADADAVKNCDCGGAEKEFKITRLRDLLKDYMGSNAAVSGFTPVEDAVYDAIEIMGIMIINEHIESATFKVDGTVINISRTSEKIKVKRKKLHEQTGEIK